MYFDFLLNKNDQIYLKILRILAKHPTHSIQRQQLSDQFGLTNFQLNKFFETVNADLATVSGDKPSFVDEVLKGTFRAQNVTTFITQKMTLLYFQRSTMRSIFEYRFFYENVYTAKQYMDDHYISHPVFYRFNNLLKTEIDNNDFYSISGINQDPEFIVRLRLFQLYYTVYTGIESPFSELDDTVQAIINSVASYAQHEIQPTQYVKLNTLIKVWILRLDNHCSISESLLTDKLRGDTYQKLQTDVIKTMHGTVEITEAEMDYFYSFLITQGFLENEIVENIDENFPEAAKISCDFINFLENKKFLEDNFDLARTNLYLSLLRVNLQFTTFYVEPTTFIKSNQISFFRQLYPTFDLVIREFLKQLRHETPFQISDRMVINLYFSYMFCLINAVPVELMRDRVFVCVDFSEGTLYSTYVIKSLQAFNHAHIVVQPRVNEKTDIYISDFHSMYIDVPQVIWMDPPTPQDWEELADLILDCKEERLKTLYPEYQWEPVNTNNQEKGGETND